MTIFSVLDAVFIGPLKLIFEIIYKIANDLIGHPGFAIIFLSLVMNILVLPLYRRADAMQEASRDIEAKLARGVAHIKKTFSGDERMMILQTYYRQNDYKPTNALNGSVSLLLEIPFFMAAYQFLSHVTILEGVPLGPIKDLSVPDGMIVIFGFSINFLPILMTLINVVSSAIYLKGFPLKTKIQLYGMAAFFLVFLYTSPSALVFYWTLNNLFSLVKTVFYKLKNPKKVLKYLCAVTGAASFALGIIYNNDAAYRKEFLVVIGLVLELPLVLSLISAALSKVIKQTKQTPEYTPNRKSFILSSVFMSVLVGVLIPSAYISASPQEYVDFSYFHDPRWYIASSACTAVGFFLVWFGVFYWLASPKGKVYFERGMWVVCGLSIINYMFFGTGLGVISSTLKYENGIVFSLNENVINAAVVIALAALLLFVSVKFKKITSMVLAVTIVAVGGMSALNVMTVASSVKELKLNESENTPGFSLSRNGKNVVVIMLDRAMGEYVPYLFNEKPELEEKFSGFVYYENVISFGGFTNFGTPALLGGYEYTPIEMNKRDSEALVTKHNEALKVMPVLFDQNGYDVTVCDPVYANYQWIPDISVFDTEPGISKYITKGYFGDPAYKQTVIDNTRRNFFLFGLMKSAPALLQPALYDDGQYNQLRGTGASAQLSGQTIHSMTSSTGMSASFVDPYNVLLNLGNMTEVTDKGENTFLLLTNDVTHDPMMLQEPEYVPAAEVNNEEYERENADRFTLDGKTLKMEDSLQIIHYQTNMAAMIALGEWFDQLRESGVYDNTRIILVSDHGRPLWHRDDLTYDTGSEVHDLEFYYPLLMVKDFDSSDGFVTSEEFMTNADVPTIASAGLIDNPKNPFTGKDINSDEKYAHDQIVIVSDDFNVATNNKNTFLPAKWASVSGDMRDKNNWQFYSVPSVLKEHALPQQ